MTSLEMFDQADTQRVQQVVRSLRQIRTAATAHFAKPRLERWQDQIRWILNPSLGRRAPLMLNDAEQLAQASSTFLLAVGFRESSIAERESLDGLLSRVDNQYGLFRPSSRRHLRPITTGDGIVSAESAANRVLWVVADLTNDARAIISQHLLTENNLGHLELDNFLTSRIGVAAPLSSDYLIAELYRRFIEWHLTSDSFLLKPVAVDRKAQSVTLPLNPDGTKPFANVSGIGIFIDSNQQGKTAKAVKSALIRSYRGKKIYPPHQINFAVWSW